MTRYGLLAIMLGIDLAGAAGAAPPTKLQRVFQFETLGVRVAYLESITGPAMHIFPSSDGSESRDYRVDGCRVGVHAKAGSVRNLELDLTPACNFNLAAFIGTTYPTTAGLTIGKFAASTFDRSSIRAQSSCVYLCGNAADPVVDFTWNGPHAMNFVGVTLGVTLASTPALAASDAWQKAMTARRGHGYVEQTGFNCDRSWDTEALRDFSSVPVNTVTIGFDLPSDFYQRGCR